MSNKTKLSQDRVHAIDNMMIFIISHVIRLRCHKIDKNGEVNMTEYNLSVNAILNILLERAFYICSFFYIKFLLRINLKLLRTILNNLV